MVRLLLFLLLISKFCLAQEPSESITANSLNTKYLEHLIKTKVDSVRAIYNAKPLINDSILYVAAKYHADWMNTNNKFSHYEKAVPNKKTPQLRVEFYGAVNYRVGENIIKSYLNKSLTDKKGKEYINNTYEDLANDFVIGWVNSPLHFANIKTKEYQLTGVTVSVNKEKGLVYAVQKFAIIDFKYKFEENNEMFSYSDFEPEPLVSSFDNISRQRIRKKYEWKIKAPKDSLKRCASCNTAIDLKMYKDHFDRKGRKMVLHSFNIAALEEIIQRRRDGFALEIVSYKPFDCGNPEYYTKPSRRNNQSLLNGRVLKPVYKKDLKKGFKKAKYSRFFRIKKDSTAKSFEMSLGKLPKDLEGYYEVNILVLKKNRVCRVIHFTDYCGENMTDSIDPTLLKLKKNYPSEPPIRKGTINFKIPFEKRKYDFIYADIEPLLGVFSRNDFTVDSANVRAYSSMEGSVEINNNLQRKRAQSILTVFEEKQDKTFKTNIETHANWYLFKKQIEEETSLSDLKELDSLGIIKQLEDKVYVNSIEKYLAQQRFGVVDLYVDYKINLKDLADTLLSELKRYYIKVEENQIDYSAKVERVFEIQYKIYELIRDGFCSVEKLDEFGRIIQGGDQAFWDQQYWLNLRLNRFKSDKEQYSFITKISIKSFETSFNRFGLAMKALQQGKYYPKENYETLNAALYELKRLTPPSYTATIDSMELVYYATMVELSGLRGIQRDDMLLKYFSELLVDKAMELELEESKILQIAKLMVNEDQDNPAYNLLKYQIQKGSDLEGVKVLFAKMGFYHIEEYHTLNYSKSLVKLYGKISQESWCGMFVGPCNISFQVFDDENLRNFYCDKCAGIKNYAQDPKQWETE